MSDRKLNYMTAEWLHITDWERDGLIAFLEESRLGTYRSEDKFNMNHGCLPRSAIENGFEGCGTVYCIGGFVALRHGKDWQEANSYVLRSHSGGLKRLYFPYVVGTDWHSITREQAIHAVENYLQTGEPEWAEVIGGAHS